MDSNGLVRSVEELRELLRPITRGEVALAAIDTETNEVKDDRFTPYGTDTRIAGFSVSFDHTGGITRDAPAVDFYVPLRHVPYDWRRKPEAMRKKYPAWYTCLTEEEGVLLEGGWKDGWDPNLPVEPCLELLQDALRVKHCRWAAHNWGFDGPMLEVEGVYIHPERMEETKFASQLSDPRPLDVWDQERGGWLVSHALKRLGEDWLGMPADAEARLKEAQEALGKGSALLWDYSMLPLRTVVAPYACQDTRLALTLLQHCRARESFKDERIQERYAVEVELIQHLAEMQKGGVEIRVDLAKQLAQEAEERLAAITREADAAAGRMLNYGNSEVLAQQLYGELGVPMYRKRSDTRKATLKMAMKYCEDPKHREVLQGVLDYRAAEKELTAFYRPLANFGAGGTIHTVIRQMEAATTRMSASKPNLQQMKKKGEVRRVFKPRDGHVFVFMDYDQIEMRIPAHYSHSLPDSYRSVFTWSCTMAKRGSCKGRGAHGPQDDAEACRRIIHHGRRADWQYKPPQLHLFNGFTTDPDFDPHQRMADIAGVDRDDAKTSNFALLYGAGYYKLAETLDCTLERAKELFHFFWEQAYPELDYVRGFIQERLRRAGPPTKYSHMDYITTLKGGRIYLDSAYKGMNYVTQRSAREVFGDGLLAVCRRCRSLDGYRVVVPVHDEAILEVHKDDLDTAVLSELTGLMAEAGNVCSVPLTVGCEMSDRNWHKDDRDEVQL